MKKIAGVVLILVGIVAIVFLIPKQGTSWQSKETRLPYSVQITNLSVMTSNTDIRMIPEEREDFEVIVQGSGNLMVHSNEHSIELYSKRNRFSLFPLRSTLVIRMPNNYHGQVTAALNQGNVTISGESTDRPLSLKGVAINTQSGSAKLARLEAEQISFKAASGSLEVKQVKARQSIVEIAAGTMKLDSYSGNIEATVESGDVKLLKTEAGTGTIRMTRGEANVERYTGNLDISIAAAGEISASNIVAPTGTMNVGRGEIHLDHYSGKLHARAEAGEIRVGFERVTDPAEITVGNGRTELRLPQKSDVALDAAVQRGNLDNEYPFSNIARQTERELRAAAGNGNHSIKVQVAAGEVSVR